MRLLVERFGVPFAVEGEEGLVDVAVDTVRVDVTGWSKEAIDSKVSELRLEGQSKFASFSLRMHRCFKDENLPCEVEPL